jgi:DNA-binding transcriptional MocR family regulator
MGKHIIYVGSFCKSIAPGIRIGFMVAPAKTHSATRREPFMKYPFRPGIIFLLSFVASHASLSGKLPDSRRSGF